MERQSRLRVVSFTLEPQQVRRLAVVAARERRSRSFVARDLIEEGLDRRERTASTGREATS